MANPVFERALDGLATMVSARAARRVLEAGVRSVAETPDTIPAQVMQTLLVDYVHHEFEQMLPREGLKRNLEQLAKRVGDVSLAASKPTLPNPGLPNPYDSSEVDAVSEALAYFTRVNIDADSSPNASPRNNASPPPADVQQSLAPVAASPTAPPASADPTSATPVQAAKSSLWQDQFDVNAKADKLKGIASQDATPEDVTLKDTHLKDTHLKDTPPKGTTMADSADTKLILSEAQLETIVMRFAQVEHARLVAAVRENGSIVTSRGAGVDLNSLSRFGLMGLRLLERSGNLRSYYLSHTQGQLFLFCFGRDTVIMLGSRDINVGTVFSTLTNLKDDL